MALQMTTEKPPKNAIVLSRSEAVNYQWIQIVEWPRKLEVWSFTWGIGGLAVSAAASGMYLNVRYRRKLKLRNFGHFSTSLPMIVGPGMCAAGLHTQIITNDLMLKQTKCPLCLQYRAVGLQLSCGLVYPVLLSPLINLLFVIRHATYRIPYWSDYKGTFKLWLELTRPLGKKLIIIAFIHALAASFVTYSEAESLYNMQYTLLKMEEEREMKKLDQWIE